MWIIKVHVFTKALVDNLAKIAVEGNVTDSKLTTDQFLHVNVKCPDSWLTPQSHKQLLQ